MLLLALDIGFGRYVRNRLRLHRIDAKVVVCAALSDWPRERPPQQILVACYQGAAEPGLGVVINEVRHRWLGVIIPIVFMLQNDDALLAVQLLRGGANVVPVAYDGRSTNTEQDGMQALGDNADTIPTPAFAGLTYNPTPNDPYWHYLARSFGPTCPLTWEVYFDQTDRQTSNWLGVIRLVIQQFHLTPDIQLAPMLHLFGNENHFNNLQDTGVVHLRASQRQLEADLSPRYLQQYRKVIERLTMLASTHSQPGKLPLVPVLLEYRRDPDVEFGTLLRDRELLDALWEWNSLSVPFGSSTSLAIRLYQLFASRWNPVGPPPIRFPDSI